MSNRTFQTDLVLFTLGHISPQNVLDKVLNDHNEVVVLSAVSCFMQKKPRIHNSSKWFEPRSISSSYCVIVRVSVVLKRTVVGD